MKPDLIITDVNMPNMGGLELIGKVRALPGFRFTPILTLTTEVMDNIRQCNDDVVTQMSEALGYIQFQDVVRQRIEQVERALQEVGEHAGLLAGNLGKGGWDGILRPTLKQRLDQHMSGYVMASQRDAHATAFGGAGQGGQDGPAIELF